MCAKGGGGGGGEGGGECVCVCVWGGGGGGAMGASFSNAGVGCGGRNGPWVTLPGPSRFRGVVVQGGLHDQWRDVSHGVVITPVTRFPLGDDDGCSD